MVMSDARQKSANLYSEQVFAAMPFASRRLITSMPITGGWPDCYYTSPNIPPNGYLPGVVSSLWTGEWERGIAGERRGREKARERGRDKEKERARAKARDNKCMFVCVCVGRGLRLCTWLTSCLYSCILRLFVLSLFPSELCKYM